MKYLFSYSLIFIFLLQSIGNTYFFLDYQLSIEKYEVNCENTEKPELKCHGKCQMTKQAQQFGFWEKNESEQKTPSLKSVKSFDVFIETIATNSIIQSNYSLKNTKYYSENYSFQHFAIAHPPPELI